MSPTFVRATITTFVVMFVLVAFITGVQAQTLTVLHNFTGGGDGATPYAGLTMDEAGNLYGTTPYGGKGNGTVYRLRRSGSGWLFDLLYAFGQSGDGAKPEARVIFGPDGTLYGTTTGGGSYGYGTVFNLKPPPPGTCVAVVCPWTETILWSFADSDDGANPNAGDLIFDQAGYLYGTTTHGGSGGCSAPGCGVVYAEYYLGGGVSPLYSFTNGSDGEFPDGGVIFDQAGNLYGTAQGGDTGYGTVYELTLGEFGWTENTIFDLGNHGSAPVGSLVFDEYGNLFGATRLDSVGMGFLPGTLYEIKESSGTWTKSYEYDFYSENPQAGVTADAACNLYGDAPGDGNYDLYGLVYKLTPSSGSWSYKTLYNFTGGNDGGQPYGSVIPDASGNLYGTTTSGGKYGVGVVWEWTP